MELPLHTKRVQQEDLFAKHRQLKELDKEMAGVFGNIIKTLLEAADTIKSEGDTNASRELTMELSHEDIKTLEEANLIRKISGGPKPNCRVFSVPERHKGRRRWICHTPGTNEIQRIIEVSCMKKKAKAIPEAALTDTPVSLTHRVLKECALCIDFASYFHQFKLPGKLRCWTFRSGSQLYQLCTIPTGAVFCPALAQIFSVGIARAVQRRVRFVEFDVYIDNLRFSGPNEAVLRAAAIELYKICDELGVTINEEMEQALRHCHVYEFLGIMYNHEAKQTWLGNRIRDKIASLPIPPDGSSTTIGQFLSIYGILSYAASAMRMCRASFYWATKFLRRRVGRPLEELCTPWTSCLRNLRTWRDRLLQTPPITHSHTNLGETAVIYTDASDSGHGAVMMTTLGRTQIIANRWSDRDRKCHINVKEAMAVKSALETLDCSGISEIKLFIDNTSVIYGVIKGDSRSYELASIIEEIWSLPAWNLVTLVQYVASKENHADLPSRLSIQGQWSSSNPFLLQRFKEAFAN